MRKLKLETDNCYHVYNRGVDKRRIFMDETDYRRFLISLEIFNTPETIGSIYEKNYQLKETKFPIGNLVSNTPLVEILAYCLNPNHYHLLLKQLVSQGIEKYMHKLNLGYTKYFNNRNERNGSLLQGVYKSAFIKSDEHLCYISAYINGNPEIHKIANADKWTWSSYQEYFSQNSKLSDPEPILSQFQDINEYKDYLKSVIKDCQQAKADIKNSYLE